jgi:hypothetical protein
MIQFNRLNWWRATTRTGAAVALDDPVQPVELVAGDTRAGAAEALDDPVQPVELAAQKRQNGLEPTRASGLGRE